MNMDDLIRKSGGGAMLSGTVPDRPWDTPPSLKPEVPNSLNNGWKGERKIARRLNPITPTGKFMMKRPS